ncbi:ESPR-type extended signal peptide-containing protein, partial [Acinetobacter sp. WCHAc060033]|uniref:ESPR-type extended signal peptide-containing protein n=1 Tax=Acinetobacter sp. WCHAc060033 TaxID=2518624 RepID=UPI002248B6C6
MNKIYKVIWNATLGTWVAVSELAKGKTKSSKVTGIVGAATVAFMVTFSPEAVANLAVCGGTTPVGAQFNTGSDATCYGAEAKATIGGAIAIGDNPSNKAIATGNDNLAIMSGATATSGDSTSTGNNIAIGHNAKATTTGGAQQATAVGSFAQATAGNATALGGTSKASGVSSVAIGNGAQATATNDVVIGSGSASNRANNISDQGITNIRGGGSVNFATGDTKILAASVVVGDNSTISTAGIAIGSKNIVDSTAPSFAIGLGNKTSGLGYNVALGVGNLVDGVGGVGIGVATKVTTDATAIGRMAYAEGVNSVAVGRIATSSGAGSIALGSGSNAGANSTIAIGQNANVTQVYGTAIGSGGNTVANATQVAGAGATAIGGNATAGAKALSADSIAIGGESVAGTATNVNAIAIGKGAQATGNQSISIGVGNKVSGNNSGAIGDPSIINGANSYSVGNNNTIGSTTTDAFALGNNVYLGATSAGVDTTSVTGTVAIGSTATSSALRGTALGYGANVTANDGVALGSGSVGGASSGSAFLTGAGAPTLGAVGVGGRRIQNLADGSAATDAVTVAQLDKSHDDTNARLVGALGAGSGATYVAGTNTYTAPTNIGGTGKTTIDDAIKASKRTVVSGTNATVVPVTAADGSITYTVNADGTTVSASPSSSVTVTPGTKNANNVTDYAVDLSATAKSDIAKGVAAKTAIDGTGLTFTGDGGTTTGVKKLGDTVAVTGDSNIATVASATGVQVKLNPALNVTSVTAGNTSLSTTGVNTPQVVVGTGANTTTLTSTANGLDVGSDKVTNVAAGDISSATSKDAVNGGQLFTTNTNVTAAQNAANAAQTTANTANTTANSALSNASIADGKAVAAQTAATTADAKAVAAQNTADQGLNFKANNGTADNVKLGETVTFADGSNTTAEYDASTNTYKYNIVSAPVFTGQVKANGFDANNNKIINVTDGSVAANSKEAVNGGQLFTTNTNVTAAQNAANAAQTTANTANTTANSALSNASIADGKAVAAQAAATTADAKAVAAQNTADQGLNFKANNGTADNVKLGETITFADGTNTTAEYDATTNTYKYNIVNAPVFTGEVKANGFDANDNKIIN